MLYKKISHTLLTVLYLTSYSCAVHAAARTHTVSASGTYKYRPAFIAAATIAGTVLGIVGTYYYCVSKNKATATKKCVRSEKQDPLGDGISSVQLLDISGSDQSIADAVRCYSHGSTKGQTDEALIADAMIRKQKNALKQSTMTFRMTMPWVAYRHLIRHRTLPCSGSPTGEGFSFFIPSQWRIQSESNKQASGDSFENEKLRQTYIDSCEAAVKAYHDLIGRGVSEDIAVGVLPQSGYITILFTGNIESILHFIELRDDKNAQIEIQKIAQAIQNQLKKYFPQTYRAFEADKARRIKEVAEMSAKSAKSSVKVKPKKSAPISLLGNGQPTVKVEEISSVNSDLSVIRSARVSFAKTRSEVATDDLGLIDTLVIAGHWSTCEHNQLTVVVKAPILTAASVMSGYLLGWSYNEVSGRYVDLPEDFFVPPSMDETSKDIYVKSCQNSYKTYQILRQASSNGVAVCRELARMALPVNTNTVFYCTGNLRSLMNFIIQSMQDKNTSPEECEIARRIFGILETKFPITIASFRTNYPCLAMIPTAPPASAGLSSAPAAAAAPPAESAAPHTVAV